MVQWKSLDRRPFRHRKEDLSPRELGVPGGQSLEAEANCHYCLLHDYLKGTGNSRPCSEVSDESFFTQD